VGRRLIISGGDGLCVLREGTQTAEHIHLPGAGALCACGGGLFVSSGCGDMIWRLDRNLMPAALFAGGPGMRQLMLSGDGERLFALCTDGNSILVLDSKSGAPLLLAGAGNRPHAMALRGNALAVAGGGEGLLLFDAGSLSMIARLRTPWPAVSAALTERYACALCRDDMLNSILLCYERGIERGRLRLPGAPGTLFDLCGMLIVCTRGRLCVVSAERMQLMNMRRAPGLGARICFTDDGLLLADELSETVYALAGGDWKRIDHPAVDLCIQGE